MRAQGSLPHPPGPPGHFIVGNLFDMPSKYAWETYADWGRKYGPLTYLNAAGQPILVINCQETATDLLNNRSAIYSDRPHLVMATELSGYDVSTALLPHGPTHTMFRKLFAQALHPRVVQTEFAPIQERLMYQFVTALLDNPEDYRHHIHRSTGEIIQTITYGDLFDGDTDLVKLASEDAINFGKALSGYAVDFIPWLKYLPDWFPGTQFKQDARTFKDLAVAARWLPFNMVKRQAAEGTAPPSFTLSLLETPQDEETEKWNADTVSSAAWTLYGAASHSIAGTLETFMLAMTLYPEVQAKARSELDKVVGSRLPTGADKDSTPYLNAILLETLRWHPMAPIGVPHRLMRDDSYKGSLIPAGTIVFVNAWGILHDEHHFPDPFVFKPERFLSGNQGDAGATTIDPWSVAFGYGMRSCQGISFTQSALWLAMSMVLYALEIRQKIDPQTKKNIVPKASWTGDSTSFTKPFVCDIVSRSPDRANLIRAAIAAHGKTQN
ncbi:hypothetical protein FRB97_001425 [Tulasnella sp. 331]|nr:hypothetical protein FRB97_001425 [Tulasnella sp. 331]